jgi:hypothetical protein
MASIRALATADSGDEIAVRISSRIRNKIAGKTVLRDDRVQRCAKNPIAAGQLEQIPRLDLFICL